MKIHGGRTQLENSPTPTGASNAAMSRKNIGSKDLRSPAFVRRNAVFSGVAVRKEDFVSATYLFRVIEVLENAR